MDSTNGSMNSGDGALSEADGSCPSDAWSTNQSAMNKDELKESEELLDDDAFLIIFQQELDEEDELNDDSMYEPPMRTCYLPFNRSFAWDDEDDSNSDSMYEPIPRK